MVARLILASPSQALSVPIRSANGRPDENPNASMVAALRVASAALSSFQPLGRWPANCPSLLGFETLDRFHGMPSPAMNADHSSFGEATNSSRPLGDLKLSPWRWRSTHSIALHNCRSV